MSDGLPLLAHVMHRVDTGGLENGMVNLINPTPADAFRHTLIALTDIADFERKCTEAQFSMVTKIDSYQQIYDRLQGRILRSTGN